MAESTESADPTRDPTTSPLRSVHTDSLPGILRAYRASLLISTYQAGKLVIARADSTALNTHFRAFRKPMGVAVDGARIALGSPPNLWEFWNVPDLCPRLEPAGKHDACYIPRTVHTTGDIDIHEMAYAGDDLWFVNTRFSCLCTYDRAYSFVPRWRPSFISALAPEDRCHLNGMGVRDGKVRYVTALARTDTPQGWRAHKRDGGVLIDLDTNAVIAEKMSMPHSPRWHDGKLWVLESGQGSLAMVDPATGRLQTVAQLDGFTRGLDFLGPYAFVGLSQVSESISFGDLPITERLKERICGVWVVDTRTGQVAAFLRFDDAVQEVFAVQLLRQSAYPEILNDDEKLIGSTYILPDAALAEVPAQLAPPAARKP